MIARKLQQCGSSFRDWAVEVADTEGKCIGPRAVLCSMSCTIKTHKPAGKLQRVCCSRPLDICSRDVARF